MDTYNVSRYVCNINKENEAINMRGNIEEVGGKVSQRIVGEEGAGSDLSVFQF